LSNEEFIKLIIKNAITAAKNVMMDQQLGVQNAKQRES
jgi:hypothetical protein